MKKKIFIASLLVLLSCELAISQKIVSWNDANKYYGQNITVEGTILYTFNSREACYLGFHQEFLKHLKAVIFKSDITKFPSSPEKYYFDKKVHITGTIKENKGKPEIILKDPSQIKILDEQTIPKK